MKRRIGIALFVMTLALSGWALWQIDRGKTPFDSLAPIALVSSLVSSLLLYSSRRLWLRVMWVFSAAVAVCWAVDVSIGAVMAMGSAAQ